MLHDLFDSGVGEFAPRQLPEGFKGVSGGFGGEAVGDPGFQVAEKDMAHLVKDGGKVGLAPSQLHEGQAVVEGHRAAGFCRR